MLSRRAPRRLARRLGGMLAVAAVIVAASGCADTADGPLVVEETVDEEVAATTTSAPPEPPRSEGTAEIGETLYEFEVTCEDRGAGEVRAVGVGDDPVLGGRVELFVEVSFVDPYVGLQLADGTFIEPSLDSPLDLYVQDDVIRASAIRFVRDLNLETGEATEVGFGEFEIHCYSYEREPPSS